MKTQTDKMHLEVARICKALSNPNINYVVVRTIAPNGMATNREIRTLDECVTVMWRLGRKSIQYVTHQLQSFDGVSGEVVRA